jgi:hypothetical protein
MKLIVNNFLVVAFFLSGVLVNAQPPCPGCPPEPPDLPINENLIFLVLIGLSLGLYSIYKYKLKTKKASV